MNTQKKITRIIGVVIGMLLMLTSTVSYGQYFGRNKPIYKKLDFEVLQSPHFEMYHYLENDTIIKDMTQQFENWYLLHQAVLNDTFHQKNPIIMYENHADFQQTTAISGNIGVGTGGVTEAFKNRVVMPFMEANAQTDHVAGHELVHAFQYHMILGGDSTNLQSLGNLPLWLVEGMAEYMSIGRYDSHTAMWMRDAVLNDDIPTIKDLNTNPKYFPYRYGQAFWAYLTGRYGDAVIRPFFETTAKEGLDKAIVKVLGTTRKELSADWQQALREYYGKWLDGKEEKTVGKELLRKEDGGNMMIAPSISPTGRYVIFLSEKNIFSLDLYLADVRTGKILRKVASSTKNSHIDAFSFLESSGTWSPDSKQFAFVVFSKGINKLVIKEVQSGKTVEELAIPGVPSFSNPAWSPDGDKIVVTGLVEGQSDLYLFDLKTKKVSRLTNDRYSDIQPQWSPDGSKIVFSSDRIAMTQGGTRGQWTFSLAVLDVNTLAVQNIDIFRGADNLNPNFMDNNEEILFLSDRDGFRNMYRYHLTTQKVEQMTDFLTGVSGITKFSPAISVARRTGRIVYTHYFKNQYDLYNGRPEDFTPVEVDGNRVSKEAAVLPVLNPKTKEVINTNLTQKNKLAPLSDTAFATVNYRPKFKLDYATGSTGAAVGTTPFGNQAGLAGGVSLLFGDMLGQHQLFSTVAVNGDILDAGGQLTYINRENRIAWGATIGHVPYQFGNWNYAGLDTLYDGEGNAFLADKVELDIFRMFEDRLNVFAQFPFSQAQRIEVGASGSRYSYRHDVTSIYYNAFGQPIFQDRQKIDDTPPGFNLGTINAAYVGDNAQFGIASPLDGYRFRIGAEQYIGGFNFTQATVDLRTYKYLKPISVAARFTHFGRYGNGANQLNPLYIGNSQFVRGYNFNNAQQQQDFIDNGWSFNQLLGSKIAVASAEIRLPLTGPERLSIIPSRFFLSELALFVDSGIAWNSFDDFNTNENTGLQPLPLLSAGVATRINLFGALVVEPFYAKPLQKGVGGTFGVNLIPGW